MNSITKSRLSDMQMAAMVKRAFGNSVFPEQISELTDGFFNATWMLKLSNGMKTVLKVSPSRGITVMRYEKNIMDTEVHILNEVCALKSVPVPKVLYYDRSYDNADGAFFFMEFVEGLPLSKARSGLSEKHYKEINAEAGRYAKQIRRIEGRYFGYISQEDKRFASWGDAFFSMMTDLLDDARDMRIELPCSRQKLLRIVNENRDILDEVKTPSLVHKDLWEGNIFVDPATAKITGFIDFERAVYGDALLEPVCGFLLNSEEFMMNYFSKTHLDRGETIRAALYKIYLFLLMVIEYPFRQYPGENCDRWQREQLDSALTEFTRL
jgi:aminoglycoside phosphotransferase (APT) family kinase protein